MSSVMERGRSVTERVRERGTLVLILGAAAFFLVVAGWIAYAARHTQGWTLYPVDFDVYRDGGLIIRHLSPPYDPKLADPLYDWSRSSLLSFTYTPFAAVVFAVVSFVPPFLDPRLGELVNVAALVGATWAAMRALGWSDRRVRLGGALLGAAAGLLTEPVFRTIYLGQINIVLMLIVIWDLTQPDTPASRRWKGALTGVAAGIKLVPLIFVPYLLLTRRFRQAFLALAGFACTVAVGFAVAPSGSADFWFNGLFAQDGRSGFPGWGGNQSLRGLIIRLAGSVSGATVPWLIFAVLLAVAGLLAAALLYRAGQQMLAVLMTALTGLLISPISWDHHWVWVVPGMMAAVRYAILGWRSRRRVLAYGCAALGAAALLIFAPWPGRLWGMPVLSQGTFTWGLLWAAPNSRVVLYRQYGDQRWFEEYHWHHDLQILAGNAYVLAGLAAFAVLCSVALATRRRPSTAAERGAATARTSGAAAVR